MTLTSSSSPAPLEQSSDLVSLARGGDRQAMGLLYAQHRELMYRYAFRMLRCEAAAKDVVQEAFTRALGAIGRTREPLHFRAWIMRIAINLCLKQIARRRRWVGEGRHEVVAPASGNPERIHGHNEVAGVAQRALQRLPPRYRQLLLLREVEGLSYNELAKSLRSTHGRIKVTLHRARVRLGAEVFAEKLLLDPETRSEVSCEALSSLLRSVASHRKLVRHLECCPACKGEQRSSKAILALLPPVAGENWPELGASNAPGSAGSRQARRGQEALGVVLVLGVAVAGLAVALHLWHQPRNLPKSNLPKSNLPKSNLPKSNLPKSNLPKGVVVKDPSRGSTSSHTSRHTSSQRAHLQRRQGSTSRPARSPLRLKVQPSMRQLWVRRGASRKMLNKPGDLHPGDILQPRGVRVVGLRFSGHQWVAFNQRVRLEAVSTERDETITPRVMLLRGRLRARASRRGGGLELRAGVLRARIGAGVMRMRRVGMAIWIEAIDGTVTLKGQGTQRHLAPGHGIRFASGVFGPTQTLLPAPRRLRPASARGVLPPSLSWDAVAGAEGYLLRLAGDTDFITLRHEVRIQERTFTPHRLRPGGTFWQVVPLAGGQQGMPSKIFRFQVTRR